MEQPPLLEVLRDRAFFTVTDLGSLGTVAVDKPTPGHAIIGQVLADLKNGPLTHLPSGMLTANNAWLVLTVMVFNLTRAAGSVADRTGQLA